MGNKISQKDNCFYELKKCHSCPSKVTPVFKSHLCPKKVTSVCTGYRFYLKTIITVEKDTSVLPKVTSVCRLNISKMSLTYQEKSKSLFFLSHLYDFLVVRLIFAVYQKKKPFRKMIPSAQGVHTQGNRILQTLKVSRTPCQECSF